MELSEYINDEAGYQSDMMNTVLPELMSLSAASVDYDAMANLLLWMVSYAFDCGGSVMLILTPCRFLRHGMHHWAQWKLAVKQKIAWF